MAPHPLLLLALCVLSVIALVVGETPPFPFFASDNAGNLVINTTSSDQDVIVNGVSVKKMAEDIEELKAIVGLTVDSDPKRGRITDVLDVHDDAVFISAQNGVFLSTGKTYVLTETSNAWSPSTLNCHVGDYVTFKWSSMEAVYETESDGTTAVSGGQRSGDAQIGGEFTVRLTKAHTYRFRAANKGFVATITAKPAGLAKGGQMLELGSIGGGSIILGGGRGSSSASTCYDTWGVMKGSGCACSVGTRRAMNTGSYYFHFCIA